MAIMFEGLYRPVSRREGAQLVLQDILDTGSLGMLLEMIGHRCRRRDGSSKELGAKVDTT